MSSIAANETYTSDVLTLNEEKTSAGMIKNTSAVFPILSEGTLYPNANTDGKVSISASTIDGFVFDSFDSQLMVCHYKVKAAGDAEVRFNVSVLADNGFVITKIIDGGVIKNDNFRLESYFEMPTVAPTEEPTAAPTQAPTQAPTEAPTPSEVTLYFTNNKGWSNVNAYVWNSETDAKVAQWPGTSATLVGKNSYNEDVYSVTVNTNAYDSVIFNGSGGQTRDIRIADAVAGGCGIYCLDNTSGSGLDVAFYEYKGLDGGDTDPTQAPTESQPSVNKLYLDPGTTWPQDGARFAAYFFGGGEAT